MDSHTLVQALIYLGSAALIVPIAVRLGLGSVLGYLIAGCIIGPWGLRLVTDAESILHFAEIGVVLMLFIIGLELDPQRLWKLRAAVFGGGALQMVICGGLLGLFCMLLGLRWQVAELIGMTLALSSTAIAMQAMNERNLMVTQMGRSAFAVLLFQDIAAIPLVAMIPLLATSSASTTMGAFALSALKVAGALVLVVLLGRYVTRPALRFVARSGLREVFSAVALFLVFGFGLDTLILKIVSSREMYGYEIVSELKRVSDNYFCLKTGTLYPLLRTMVSDGLLEMYDMETCKQKRTFYKITDSGLEYLQQETQNWKNYTSAVNKVLGK